MKKSMTAILFPVDDQDIAFLRGQWDELLSFYTSDISIKDNSIQMLQEKYSEKSRFYHNLSHVKALLQSLESFKHKIQDPHAIRFSMWFHDVVYDTTRNDNEEESARLAAEMLGKLHASLTTIEMVRDLILATKGHRGKDLSEDAKLFLDLDLAILGTREETYKKYSKAIRAEYAWVPELVYRTRRSEILKSFLDRERIYFTDEMRTRFEEQARKNMICEIKSLHSAA